MRKNSALFIENVRLVCMGSQHLTFNNSPLCLVLEGKLESLNGFVDQMIVSKAVATCHSGRLLAKNL